MSDLFIYNKLGAHVCVTGEGDEGARFAVWAPNASRVSVVGDFNHWDGAANVMDQPGDDGIWQTFVPGASAGAKYKFEIHDRAGDLLPLKTDPYGSFHEPAPGNSSIIYHSAYSWQDDAWMQQRSQHPALDKPVCIYEVHLGSWRRKSDGSFLNYRELAVELLDYVSEMGFTHLELMPVSEHPFDGSWGYQPVGMFAPTCRFGTPDDFRFFVDHCHAAGIGVIVDWVPAHFPRDEHGLRRFDGTALYEHEDPRKGEHSDWGTLIFNYGRSEVADYLIGSALYWIEEFHVDALRVDAVASMLYLDYSRDEGEWIPNEHGGNENLEAVEFLRRLNTEVHAHGATTFAEESTAWPGVSRPVESGGLGFTYKWNMGWMNDNLGYMSEDPVHRKHHHNKMTFGLVYAFDENFVLPLSHDEVVHGKRSMIGRMPGDDWQRFANLRAFYAAMYAHPGKKLLFMGNEFAQPQEWNHDQALDWAVLEHAPHQGIQRLVRDLNSLYTDTPALHEIDFDHTGFEWLAWDDSDNSVLSWIRFDVDGNFLICVSNFTPIPRPGYRIGTPEPGQYHEVLNTDHIQYGGSGKLQHDVETEPFAHHDRAQSILLDLPPLATIILERVRSIPPGA